LEVYTAASSLEILAHQWVSGADQTHLTIRSTVVNVNTFALTVFLHV